MDWLTNIFRGSDQRIAEGYYHGHQEDDDDTTTHEAGLLSDFDREEIDRAIAISRAEEDEKRKQVIEKDDDSYELAEDEQAIQESLNRMCGGCNRQIERGRPLSCMGRCHACNQPISCCLVVSDNRPYHRSCYKCYVCKNFLIPMNQDGRSENPISHPFWDQDYCPSHNHDGTPRCCSCERMKAVDATYLDLEDGRKLCLECLDSSIMDTHECQPLYLEIQDFFEGLNMKVEQQVPLLLVKREALKEAMGEEKKGHHSMEETRGLCRFEEKIVIMVSKKPIIWGYRIKDMFTKAVKVVRNCEVTAILVLYGLPRLLIGSILAHEMMHAWLRLKGYPPLSPYVEEGICQVLAHMWLDSEIIDGSATNVSSSSSLTTSSKKGKRSEFEKRLGGCFKHQIENSPSPTYGEGFRAGNKDMLKYGLERTLDHIYLTGSFPTCPKENS